MRSLERQKSNIFSETADSKVEKCEFQVEFGVKGVQMSCHLLHGGINTGRL